MTIVAKFKDGDRVRMLECMLTPWEGLVMVPEGAVGVVLYNTLRTWGYEYVVDFDDDGQVQVQESEIGFADEVTFEELESKLVRLKLSEANTEKQLKMIQTEIYDSYQQISNLSDFKSDEEVTVTLKED